MTANPEALHRRCICVVEDEPLNLRLVVALVERLGHEVVTARCGRDAVALLQRRPVDLVLLDLGLPDMRGQRVARQLRKLESTAKLRIFALSASSSDDAALRDAGFDGHLAKPLREEDLRRVLADAAVPLLDRVGLLDRVCGDDALVRELLVDFVEIADALVLDVATALASTVRADVKASTHRLKGALLAIGAQRAAASAETLEDGSLGSDLADLASLLAIVACDVSEARAAAQRGPDAAPFPPFGAESALARDVVHDE